jgi:hypothetical protein
MKVIEILSNAALDMPYNRGRDIDGGILRHAYGRSFFRLAECPLSAVQAAALAADYPGLERPPVSELELAELNRQPSRIAARVIDIAKSEIGNPKPESGNPPPPEEENPKSEIGNTKGGAPREYDYRALQQLAAEAGLKTVGVSKDDLLKQLVDKGINVSSAVKA